MTTPPDWNLYRAFLAVIDEGSLSGAARRLGLAQPTVGRQIEALEAALSGEALFTRSPGGLRPTRAAAALEPHARAMAVAADALIRTAGGDAQGERGIVRLTASDIVSAEVLPPMLTRFRERHPGIAIELAPSNRVEDLLRRDADIAVRMARPSQNALHARRIGSVSLKFHGHRDYLARHGEPKTLEDLLGHPLIGYDRIAPPAAALERLGLEISPSLFALRCDNELAQLAALRAGYGLCPCQTPIARRDPDLIPLLEGIFAFDLEFWVVMHEDLKADRRLRLLFDHLVAELLRYVAAGHEPASKPAPAHAAP